MVGIEVRKMEKTLSSPILTTKLSRRKTAQIRRTEHENAYKSVQNPCSPFFGRSAESAPDLAPSIRPVSTVAVRVIGNDEVSGSIPLPGTIPQKTTERGALSEMEVMVRLARLGASVWTPAFGHDHSFDLIAHWNGCTSRVQVKTMRDVDDNSISLSGTRVIDRAGGKQFPVITADDCDVIIGYHPGLEMAYVIRPVGKTRYTLRKNPAKNGQIIGIMYESDFRLTSLDQIKPVLR
jgi:PD-(D/E)XK nuclease superfamily protein